MEETRFEAYADALEAAYDAIQRVRPKVTNDSSFPVQSDETFQIDAYGELCPVCLKISHDV